LSLLSGDDSVLRDIPVEEPIKISKGNLYVAYSNWCAEVGEKVHKQKMFNQYLPEKKDNKHGRYWQV
jgi:phage/plasmid-associated DNA primase